MGLGELGKQGAAATTDVAPGDFEVARIPGVGDRAGGGGVVEEEGDFSLGVAVEEAKKVFPVLLIHADDEVEGGVVFLCDLPGGMGRAGDSVGRERLPGGRIEGVAELLAAGGRRGDVEAAFHPGLPHQLLQNEFGHGAAADVAMADKENVHRRNPFL